LGGDGGDNAGGNAEGIDSGAPEELRLLPPPSSLSLLQASTIVEVCFLLNRSLIFFDSLASVDCIINVVLMFSLLCFTICFIVLPVVAAICCCCWLIVAHFCGDVIDLDVVAASFYYPLLLLYDIATS